MLTILYVSSYCDPAVFDQLLQRNMVVQQQAQKYHYLLANGFSEAPDSRLYTISIPPIPTVQLGRKYLPGYHHKEGRIDYNHLPVWNVPYIKNLIVLFSSFLKTWNICKRGHQTVVICDILNVSVSMGALLAAKLRGIPTVGIVTDVPAFRSQNPNSFEVKLNTGLMNAFDSYVFLTEAMKEVVTCEDKPYIVIEGQVDIQMGKVSNLLADKQEKKVCIYAGGLQRIYGIPYLVQAFLKADIPNAELHIYGSGDYQEELAVLCRQHPSLRYFGVRPNAEVVEEEMKAILLINPRPTTEEYTKYSFPSKNMEYMVSGTPLLTTKLPGMPAEYDEYVYLIDEETVEGLSKSITKVLSKSPEELHTFGASARDFVLREKNNVRQARKIIEMIEAMS